MTTGAPNIGGTFRPIALAVPAPTTNVAQALPNNIQIVLRTLAMLTADGHVDFPLNHHATSQFIFDI
jgi:hypothetical protein